MQDSAALAIPAPADRQPPAADQGGPWGPWATAGWSALVFLLYSAVQLVGFGAVGAALAAGPLDGRSLEAAVEAHIGLVLWVGLLIAAPLGTAAVALLAAWRRPPSLTRALGLVRPRRRPALLWLAAALGAVLALDLLSAWLGRPVVPDFMARAYPTAGVLPALWLAVVVAAPVFEELLFRGFLLPGLAASRLGGAGAVVVTALAFAAIHIQYDLYDMTAILVLGLLFGAARLATGSTLLTLLMHSAINLAAMIEASVVLGGRA
jgi:membrane protease YdiL (CAAX protease family)